MSWFNVGLPLPPTYSIHSPPSSATLCSLFVPRSACTSNFQINNGQTDRESGKGRHEAKHASADELFLRVRLFPSVRRPGEIYTACSPRLVSSVCSSAWIREQKGVPLRSRFRIERSDRITGISIDMHVRFYGIFFSMFALRVERLNGLSGKYYLVLINC